MSTEHLTGIEICKIIKECKKAGVSEIAYAGLTLKFHARSNECATGASKPVDLVQSAQVSENHVQMLDESAVAEAEEAQLLIDDSLAFEQSQIDKHIERAKQYEKA